MIARRRKACVKVQQFYCSARKKEEASKEKMWQIMAEKKLQKTQTLKESENLQEEVLKQVLPRVLQKNSLENVLESSYITRGEIPFH